MTTCLRKSCSFGLLSVSFVNFYEFVFVLLSLFGFEGGLWDLIVLMPDHCLSVYFVNYKLMELSHNAKNKQTKKTKKLKNQKKKKTQSVGFSSI